MLQVPEAHRVRRKQLATTAAAGHNGAFTFPGNELIFDGANEVKSPIMFVCIVSDADFWETIAVCVQRAAGPPRYPTLDELQTLRNIFWKGEGDNVFIYLPNDSFKGDGAMVATLLNKPGFNFPVPDYNRLGLERKNIIQRINDIL